MRHYAIITEISQETLVCITFIALYYVIFCIHHSLPGHQARSQNFSHCNNHASQRSLNSLFVAGTIYSLSGGTVTIYICDHFCTFVSLYALFIFNRGIQYPLAVISNNTTSFIHINRSSPTLKGKCRVSSIFMSGERTGSGYCHFN